ncbi:NAD-dependent epimerase [Muricauda sp. SCSIO 64092]|uniref:NAD-dependent epimerase n=1 Tax=Allomuricauda sp. SCSIO 64092 TaxID=2908842 RepID=UPI001FF40903|nr:NAD-dependent epimerase [Muricauda sp. SCSIO 64092]UOY06098.1 NAD-dependent epimerase [Muricauda sp. SCSIO 64092]
MKILVTGAAGFIGYHVSKSLIDKGHTVVGLDNLNDYYDVNLKYARLVELGIPKTNAGVSGNLVKSQIHGEQFSFIKLALEDKENLHSLFAQHGFEVVCNLAAQAGVRYSLENPSAYVDSNIVGFLNILECCRSFKVKHLVYASSSSVYGMNKIIPFETKHNVDHPISLYAATKKSNELMAHTYSHLYKFPTTGLRFFTVYGPWGRPDMAMFLFTDAMVNGKPIKVFNNGNMERDFTYIDDITEGVIRIIEKSATNRVENNKLYKIYNIGNNNSVKLLDFIDAIEKELNIKANRQYLPIQPGDVEKTWANVDDLIKDYDYEPNTSIKDGVASFIDWYKKYYRLS